MQNLAGTSPHIVMPSADIRQLIAADLRNLIAQIETSMRLIKTAMTEEEEADQPGSIDVIVLDDVTPRYVTANAALGACKAGLDLALQCLSEFGKPVETGTNSARHTHLIA